MSEYEEMLRRVLRGELRLPSELRAPYGQRYFPGGSMAWVVPSGVRNLIRYKEKLVIKTGCGGGIYKYPPLEEVWTAPTSIPGYTPDDRGSYDMEGWDAVYFPGAGGGLDVLLCGGNYRVFIVKPDWSVECITLHPYHGEFQGFFPLWDSDEVYVWLSRGYVYKVNVAEKTYEHISNCPETIAGKGGIYREIAGVPHLYLPSNVGGVWRLNLDTLVWTQFEAGIRFYRLHGTHRLPYDFHAFAYDGKRHIIARSTDCETWEYLIVPLSFQGGDTSVIKEVTGWLTLCTCHGHLWAFQTVKDDISYTPIMGLPGWYEVIDWDIFEGCLALGGNEQPYWPWGLRDLAPGMLELIPLSQVKFHPSPAYALIWGAESISAGETSLPVVTGGWRDYTLMFETDTAGVLTIEVDLLGDGEFKTFDTWSLSAGEARVRELTGNYSKLRLKFDTAATVTAKLYLAP